MLKQVAVVRIFNRQLLYTPTGLILFEERDTVKPV